MNKTTAQHQHKRTSNITPRYADQRGRATLPWLDSRHSFSFGDYYDPTQMGFRNLRVINEDKVAPGGGFGTHPHRNMEIFSYVISGQLEHKDNIGNGRILKAGDFQYMSAGKGVLHSEFNPSDDQASHFLQIWIQPNEAGGSPRYADRSLSTLLDNQLHLIASPEGRDDSMEIRQDAEIYLGTFDKNQAISTPPESKFPYHWIQLISGRLEMNQQSYHPGDGIAINGNLPEMTSTENDTKLLIFSMK